jgi:hypothetical protein
MIRDSACLIILMLVYLAVFTVETSVEHCISRGGREYGSKCYLVVKKQMSFGNAYTFCKDAGFDDLVEIQSSEEYNLLIKSMNVSDFWLGVVWKDNEWYSISTDTQVDSQLLKGQIGYGNYRLKSSHSGRLELVSSSVLSEFVCQADYSSQRNRRRQTLLTCFGKSLTDQTVCNGNGACLGQDICVCDSSHSGNQCQYYICKDKYKEQRDGPSCNGRGSCTGNTNGSNMKCTCNTGYSGVNCEYSLCYSVNSSSPAVCSGHGSCVDINNCICSTGYTGTQCQPAALCDNKLSTDPTVCSGHGACVGTNICSCSNSYYGSICQNYTCFSVKLNDTANICSGHGTCVSGDVCTCQSNYNNTACQDWYCSGIRRDMPNVCSGQGVCTAPNVCNCNSTRSGPNCQYPVCFSIPSNNVTVCNGHGTCSGADKCTCSPGWTGISCSTKTCFNIAASNSTYVCNGHGTCTDVDKCSCGYGYKGYQCGEFVCFGANDALHPVCSSHGSCIGVDTCSCLSGYTGASCNITTQCFGTPFNNPSVCSGHGSCAAENSCICNSSYIGTECQYPVCYNIPSNSSTACSGHGICTGPDLCTCSTGYQGSQCDIKTCFNIAEFNTTYACSGHGSCVDLDNCSCVAGYQGSSCQNSICFGQTGVLACSGHGSCLAPDTCSCSDGYTGPNCQYSICYTISGSNPTVCSGVGNCTSPDSCACKIGYTGLKCQTARTCNNVIFTSNSVCSGHGECSSQDVCSCFTGYTGQDCQYPVCYSIGSNSDFVCSSHGTCSAPNTCNCRTGYSEAECQTARTCGSIEFTLASVCSGHGDCTSQDVCACTTGYTGTNCQYPICFTKNSTDTEICSRHGICSAPDNCSCNSDYTGDQCQYPMCFGLGSNDNQVCNHINGTICSSPNNCSCPTEIVNGRCTISCYGISYDNSTVCSGRGVCSNVDTCSCNTGSIGRQCEHFVCQYRSGDSSNVCSNHGQCVGFNNCSCSEGYTGNDCQNPLCFGISSLSTSVCSNSSGSCVGKDQCECISGKYIGEKCQFPICYGIPANDTSVCSGKGICNSVDTCTCDSGYGGDRCNQRLCYGILSDNSNVCQSHGICVEVDTCACYENWVGNSCSIPVCYGVNASASNVCGVHGQCVGVDSCQCDDNWSGPQCTVPSCYGYTATESSVCSNHGVCTYRDHCECSDNWTGYNCQLPICYSINSTDNNVCSRHGSCSSPDTCSCTSEWRGEQCQYPVCYGFSEIDAIAPVCNGHGLCIAPQTCSCNDQYTGDTCNIPVCFGTNASEASVCSGYGDCVGPNTCSCQPFHSGEKCNIPQCFTISADEIGVCTGHGNCVDTDTCECSSKWTGNKCDIPLCYGINATSNNVCNRHGSCLSEDQCLCSYMYSGDNCELDICSGIPSNESTVCHSRGICTDYNICTCAPGYSGSDCELLLCNFVQSNSPVICSGHGSCSAPDICDCQDGWTGNNCNVPICYGNDAVSPTVCGGHGTCIASNSCICSSGYLGDDCTVATCNGIAGINASVCSGRGTCVSKDTCSCSDGYIGGDCEVPICNDIAATDLSVCNSGDDGTCVGYNNCTCLSQYVNGVCMTLHCFGKNTSDTDICSGHGFCSAPDSCQCSTNYGGQECQYIKCNGIISTDGSVCHNHGNCTAIDTCSCIPGYTGADCEITLCYGIPHYSSDVCSGNGICSTPDHCTCTTGYTSSDCSVPICFGQFDSSSCSGHGVCVHVDTCQCGSNYGGPQCNVPYCYGIIANSSTSCSGHGVCTDVDTCTCSDKYTGSMCETAKVESSACLDGYFGSTCQNSVSNFRLSNGGDRLIGNFSHTAQFGSIDCFSIVDVSTLIKIGRNATCRWCTDGQLEFEIVLGENPSITTEDQIIFNVNAAIFNTSDSPVYVTVQILPAFDLILPIAHIQAPNIVGTCDNITLDGSASIDNLNKGLQYRWDVLEGESLTLINDWLQQQSKEYVTIPHAMLEPNITYVFRLQVINYVNIASSIVTATIIKSDYAVGQAVIRGTPVQEVSVNQFFMLEGSVDLTECITTYDYQWKQISGPPVTLVLDNNNRDLLFSSGSLTSATIYVFEFTASPKDHSYLTSHAQVTIKTKAQDLIAKIEGGNRSLSKQFPFVIDASGSTDPDSVITPLPTMFRWSCWNIIANSTCEFTEGLSPLANANNQVSIPANALPSGTYIFAVSFTKEDRSASASVTIELVDNTPPVVSIVPLSHKINTDKRIIVEASVMSSTKAQISTQWTVTSGNLKLNKDTIETDSDRSILAVRPNVLTPGESYTFRFEAKDEYGIGSAEVTVEANGPPSPGVLTISPQEIQAIADIEIICTDFFDADGPLSYAFGYMDEIQNVFIPLNIRPTIDNKFKTNYIPGGTGSNDTIVFVARVSDSFGATTEVMKRVSIKPALETIEELRTYMDQALSVINYVDLETLSVIGHCIGKIFSPQNTASRRITSDNDKIIDEIGTIVREKVIVTIEDTVNNYQVPLPSETVSAVSSVVAALTNNPYQISNTTSYLAEVLISNMTDKLDGSFSMEASDALGRAVSNLMQNLQLQTSDANNAEPDIDFPNMNGPRSIKSSFTDKYSKLLAVSQIQQQLLDNLGIKILKNTMIGLEPIKLKTSSFLSIFYKEEASRLPKKTIEIETISGELTKILFPATFIKTDSSETFNDKSIGVKFNIQENPYVGTKDSDKIVAPVLTVTFSTDSIAKVNVTSLAEPLSMILPVKGGVNVSAIQMDPTNPTGGLVPTCRYWNENNKSWSTDGCRVRNVTLTSIICECTHTTDYSGFLEYVAPKLNILDREDFINIKKLNRNNMITLLIMCTLLVIYVVLMIVFSTGRFILKDKAKVQCETSKLNTENVGPIRRILYRLRDENIYLSIFIGSGKDNFPRTQQLTVVYVAILGILTGNALTFGNKAGNETQFAIGWIVSELLNYPFVLFFTIAFLSTAPYKQTQKRTASFKIYPIDQMEQDSNTSATSEAVDYDSKSVTSVQSNSTLSISAISHPCNDLENQSEIHQIPDDGHKKQSFYKKLVVSLDKVISYADNTLVELQHKMEHLMERITWQGIVVVILITLLYMGVVTGVTFIIPLAFKWFKSDHQVALAMIAVIAYFVFLEIVYIRLRYRYFKRGEIVSWRLTTASIIVLILVLTGTVLICIGLVPVIILKTPPRHPWFVKLMIIESGMCILNICAIIWLIICTVRIDRSSVTDEEFDDFSSSSQELIAKEVTKPKKSFLWRIEKWYNSEYWFPWYTLFIIYPLAFVFIGVTSFMLVLYGIKFDNTNHSQSTSWLKGSALAIVTDVFIRLPIEFFIKSIIVVALIRFFEGLFFSRRKRIQEKNENKNQQLQVSDNNDNSEPRDMSVFCQQDNMEKQEEQEEEHVPLSPTIDKYVDSTRRTRCWINERSIDA